MKRFLLFFVVITGCSMLCCSYLGCKRSAGDAAIDKNVAEILYRPTGEIFPNPERGFMHLYAVAAEGKPLELAAMKALKSENVTLVHRNYYFEKFKDKPLSAAQLELMQSDFNTVREAGCKIILCFAYTGIEYVYYNGEADAPLSTIEMHLDQLKPLFESNKDVIAFVQAGFIGPWGEWHSSTNNLTTPENMKKVLHKMMASIPADIMLQVRTPRIKQTIFDSKAPIESAIAYSGQGRARVGHYNDCFLSGPTDYDTYVDLVAEKNYISSDCLYVPAGGETCPPQGGAPGCELAIAEMTKLKWTYLNLDWYVPTLNGWRNSGCFDDFQRNLGYRLSLISAKLPKQAASGQTVQAQMVLENYGYAPVYHAKNTSLILKETSTGKVQQIPLKANIRSCKPAAWTTIDETIPLTGIPAGTYELYLKIADRAPNLADKPAYCIRLANAHIKGIDNGWNALSHQLTVVNGQ